MPAMQRRAFLASVATIGSAVPLLGLPGIAAATTGTTRVTGPYTHENLALYFAHGPSAPGPVPLTLQEAMAKGTFLVHETGDVNRLIIENRGRDEVYVQAGDIVKGGKQDRVLTTSMLVPPGSGPTPVGAYCVEQGRWQQRGTENATRFTSSDSAMPSLKAKIAMKAPEKDSGPSPLQRGDGSRRQNEVWRDVAETQNKLTRTLGAAVAAPESRSSLQLSLENKKVRETLAAYVTALKPLIDKSTDSLGFAFAVNGKLNSADLYPSHGLFRKLWPKLLEAAATEALAERNADKNAPPAAAAPDKHQISGFLSEAERGRKGERTINNTTRLGTGETDKSYYFETRKADGVWVHRNYLAR